MASNTTTENWNAISQLFDLTQTSQTEEPRESTPTASSDNWDAISNLFGISPGTEIREDTGIQERISEVVPSTVTRRGQLIVEATNDQGVTFVNPVDRTVQVTFVPDANVTWTIGKNNPSHWYWTTAIAGMSNQKTNSNYPAPELPAAALIAKKDTSESWEIVGSPKTILLQPRESVKFICNDNHPHFGDNDGHVTIWWFLDLTQGTFDVEAAVELNQQEQPQVKVSSFSNPFDRKVQLRLVPEGYWQSNSTTQIISHLGKSGSGNITDADQSYLQEDLPVGCLLFKKEQDEVWAAVGESRIVELEANASLEFACNAKTDTSPRGAVTVKWVLNRVLA